MIVYQGLFTIEIIEEHSPSESAAERAARHQRIRLRRLGLSAVSYTLQIGLVAIIAYRGPLTSLWAFGYAAGQLAIVSLFYLCFRTGWNLRSSAPNLTLAQVLAPAVPSLILLYQLDLPEAQAALALTAVVPLLYGTLDLSIAGFAVAAMVYGLGYIIVIFSHGWFSASNGAVFNNWILLAAVLIVMPQVVLLSSLINRLRRTLHERNHQIREAMTRLSAMAVRDDLTGLHNRRWLMELLEREQMMIRRHNHAFCVGIIDVDYFKAINDSHGHPVGDRVLRELGQYLAEGVREIDGFGRFGGEEFLWIVPATGMDAAFEAAERMRRRAAGLVFVGDDGSRFSVTLSIGLARNDRTLKLSDDILLRRADNALYAAKQNGRNQTVRASIDSDSSRASVPANSAEIA